MRNLEPVLSACRAERVPWGPIKMDGWSEVSPPGAKGIHECEVKRSDGGTCCSVSTGKYLRKRPTVAKCW